MYKDNSLIPAEAVRLAALGLTARGPQTYADLARDIRHFIGRMVGPSLDLLAPSLELLMIEGLIEAEEVKADAETQIVRLNAAGREELRRLLEAGLRGPLGEAGRLVIALKLAFLHLLPPAAQRRQCEMLAEICAKEKMRLADLLDGARIGAALPPLFSAWLEHEIALIESRRDWFLALRDRLPPA